MLVIVIESALLYSLLLLKHLVLHESDFLDQIFVDLYLISEFVLQTLDSIFDQFLVTDELLLSVQGLSLLVPQEIHDSVPRVHVIGIVCKVVVYCGGLPIIGAAIQIMLVYAHSSSIHSNALNLRVVKAPIIVI